jgi:nucleoid-associated protein YgaU
VTAVDLYEVTMADGAALWTPPVRAGAGSSPVPAVEARPSQLLQTVGDPRALSALLMVGLFLMVGFRHPLARAIGTEGSPPQTMDATPKTAAAAASQLIQLPRTLPAVPNVPLHAPRDPFAPEASTVASSTASAPVTVGASSPSSASGTTATTSYRVRPGDSLWSVARRTMTGPKTAANVATAWRQIYADNRAVIGSDPGVLHVGVVLKLRAPQD